MLELKNLKVKVESKEIIKGINLDFKLGKTYFVIGKNGSGKSSLMLAVAGHPKYKVNGEIIFDNENISNSKPEERAKKGIFLSFQNVPEIRGIKLLEYLRTIYNNHLKISNPEVRPLSPFLFKRFLKKYIDELNIHEDFLDRDLNVGFSGGEKRKIEMLQMKLLDPKYIILDEIDSGLDVDALALIGKFLSSLDKKNKCVIIITHRFEMLELIPVDEVVVLENGKVREIGGKEIIEKIRKEGFEK
ncbi:MAG: Fe-S cluster assembly ATPase SufC [Candidatus Gracilibacteria bacterium]|nr:Fe-S cluster assembly ATPase SufC [Candidatus Gracilibacteria bacterium]